MIREMSELLVAGIPVFFLFWLQISSSSQLMTVRLFLEAADLQSVPYLLRVLNHTNVCLHVSLITWFLGRLSLQVHFDYWFFSANEWGTRVPGSYFH